MQILTAGEKPAEPSWAGIGDFDVVQEQPRSLSLRSIVALRYGTGRRSAGSWWPHTCGLPSLSTKGEQGTGEGIYDKQRKRGGLEREQYP